MKLNRREFGEQILGWGKKALVVGGLAALQPWELVRLLGVNNEQRALHRLMDFDLSVDAATLPLNFVSVAGTVPTGGNFANGASELTTNAQTAGDGSSSGIDNTDTSLIKNGGSKNIRINMTGGTITQVHDTRCTLSPVVMDTVPTISMRVYNPSGINSFGVWDWSNNSGDSNAFRFNASMSPNGGTQRGWQYFQLHRDIGSLIGSGNWQNDFVLTRLSASVGAGTTAYILLDQQYYGAYQHPVIPWIFEGGHDTHYTVGFNAWATKYMQGTLAIPTSLLDTTNFLTTEQVDEMYAAGWDVIHMSDTTTALTGLTVQQVVDRLSTADTTLRSKGWTRTMGILASPGTTVSGYRTDTNMITALTTLGYRMAIDKWQDYLTVSTLDPVHGISLNPYRVPAMRTENPDTLTEYNTNVTEAIRSGLTRILRTGSIVTGAGSGQIETADHTSLLYTLSLKHYAGTLSCIPLRKFMSGISGRMVRS